MALYVVVDATGLAGFVILKCHPSVFTLSVP